MRRGDVTNAQQCKFGKIDTDGQKNVYDCRERPFGRHRRVLTACHRDMTRSDDGRSALRVHSGGPFHRCRREFPIRNLNPLQRDQMAFPLAGCALPESTPKRRRAIPAMESAPGLFELMHARTPQRPHDVPYPAGSIFDY